jgi:hypothetical protein
MRSMSLVGKHSGVAIKDYVGTNVHRGLPTTFPAPNIAFQGASQGGDTYFQQHQSTKNAGVLVADEAKVVIPVPTFTSQKM